MRQQAGFTQHQLAHGFEIVQRGFVAEMAKGLAHFREQEFGLVAETEEDFGASESFSCARDLEDFVRRHGVRAGVAGIAAEDAITAVVATKIGQWEKNFAGVRDDAGLEALFGGASRSKESGEVVVGAANEAEGGLA